MTPFELEQLLHVARARHEVAQAQLRPVVEEEQRIRKLLSDLAQDEKIGRLSLIRDSAFRSVRGDEAWNLWVGRNRRALNMQLASVLVRKEAVFKAAQETFGRADALESLVRNARLQKERIRQRKSMDQILDHHLLGL